MRSIINPYSARYFREEYLRRTNYLSRMFGSSLKGSSSHERAVCIMYNRYDIRRTGMRLVLTNKTDNPLDYIIW